MAKGKAAKTDRSLITNMSCKVEKESIKCTMWDADNYPETWDETLQTLNINSPAVKIMEGYVKVNTHIQYPYLTIEVREKPSAIDPLAKGRTAYVVAHKTKPKDLEKDDGGE